MIELPDYKKIAKKVGKKEKKEVDVSQEELERALKWLSKSRAKFTIKNNPAQKGDFIEIEYRLPEAGDKSSELSSLDKKDAFILGEGHFIAGFEDKIIGMKAGESREIMINPVKSPLKRGVPLQAGQFNRVKLISVQNVEFPEITDDFAKGLGNFESLAALKENIKKGLKIEKEELEKQRTRAEILEKINQETKIEIPEALVEREKNHMLENLKRQAEKELKISEELLDYLKKEAEKRIKKILILREIGIKEGIDVQDQELEQEAREVLKRSSGLDPVKIREYTKEALRTEKIFNFLENL